METRRHLIGAICSPANWIPRSKQGSIRSFGAIGQIEIALVATAGVQQRAGGQEAEQEQKRET